MIAYLNRHKKKMRLFATAFIITLLTGLMPLNTLADNTTVQDVTMVFILENNGYTINGQLTKMDVKPTIVESRTMLPIRYVAEPLGATIGWDEETQKVTVSLADTKIELWVGQSNAKVNGATVPIDGDNTSVKPLILSSRTMLPVRFVAETLGCKVGWQEETKEVTITNKLSSIIPGMEMKAFPQWELSGIQTPIAIRPEMEMKATLKSWDDAEKDKPITVIHKEADIPVVMDIGRGYDVFGMYANTNSLRQRVLDTDKLINDGKMERMTFNEYTEEFIEGKNISEYSRAMSSRASGGGSFLGFGGSVSVNYDTNIVKKSENYYATHYYLVKKYGVYVVSGTNLKNYMTDHARKAINDIHTPPEYIFENYGHYVYVNGIVGGRIDYNMTAKASSVSTYEGFRAAAKAKFNAVVVNAGASGSYSTETEKKNYESVKEGNFKVYGGVPIDIGMIKNDYTALNKWALSVTGEEKMVDFGKGSKALIPIWELCDDQLRAEKLRKAFEEESKGQTVNWAKEQYIVDIVIVEGKTEIQAREQVPAGYMPIDVDLNKGAHGRYIFLCYVKGEEIDDAYTDFFMEQTKSVPESLTLKRSHNANEAVFTRITTNLNSGCATDFGKIPPLYLWSTQYKWTSGNKSKTPITEIDVVLNIDEKPDDWEVVYFFNSQKLGNANAGTKGKNIYIIYKRAE